MEEINALTEKIIGCAIEVHKQLGPSLLEAAYEATLCIELEVAGLHPQRQVSYPAVYKGRTIGDYRLDIFVEDAVIMKSKVSSDLIPCSKRKFSPTLRSQERKLAC